MPTPIRRRTVVTSLAASALATPHIARAAVRVVRLGHNNPDGTHFDQGSKLLAAIAAADPVLAPVIRIEVHGRAELGDELALLRSCKDGTLDMALTATSAGWNIVPQIGLLDTPFLFKSPDRARATLDGKIGAELAEIVKAHDLSVLAWAENGMRHITSNRPVRTPADLAGLKLRVPQSEVELISFKALGADPSPLPFNELRVALQTGRFDAEENPINVILANKLNEVQKYLSLTGHIYSAAFFVASQDLMEDLTAPQRGALVACAKLGAAKTRQVADLVQRDGVSTLTAAGMTLVDQVDVPAFMAAAKPTMSALGQRFGAELMEQLIASGT